MAWRVRSDIALGVVCGMSRISLVVMTGHAAARTGGLAAGYEAIYIGRSLGMFSCQQLARGRRRWSHSIPSTPRYFGDGRVETQVPYRGC